MEFVLGLLIFPILIALILILFLVFFPGGMVTYLFGSIFNFFYLNAYLKELPKKTTPQKFSYVMRIIVFCLTIAMILAGIVVGALFIFGVLKA